MKQEEYPVGVAPEKESLHPSLQSFWDCAKEFLWTETTSFHPRQRNSENQTPERQNKGDQHKKKNHFI